MANKLTPNVDRSFNRASHDWYYPYWGPLLLKMNIEESFVNKLMQEGNKAKSLKQDSRRDLAGELEGQFYYEKPQEWFIPKFLPYWEWYRDMLLDYMAYASPEEVPAEIEVGSLWINYQRKMEHQPPHNHSEDFSFVIYLQVPSEIVIEAESMKGKRNNAGPGMVTFYHGPDLKFTRWNYSAMPSVGDLYIFPSHLTHYVNSFKSDVERISVSGNFSLIIPK